MGCGLSGTREVLMTLSETMLEKLVTPKPLAHMTTRLPTRFAKTNASLIASLKKAKELGSVKG